MFFQESEQTKQGSWYEGTIVDLSLNTLAKKRQRSLNNNNNDEIEPTLDVVDVPMTTSIAEVLPEAMLEHEEVADDTLLIEAKMPVSNNVNTNNVEEKAQPSEEVASAEKPIADSLIEEKTLEGASNNNNNSVAELMQAVDEKQPEPEKPVRISPVKIKIRVNSEANKEKEPEASADQNEIELINPWEMLVIKW
jgi:FtsZ-interacting cell division protein ZipA